MPRHLISDAHEWINEIPTVPIYYLAKLQPRERAWQNQRGKKTLSSSAGFIVRQLVGTAGEIPGSGDPPGGKSRGELVNEPARTRGKVSAL
jgi:hypothetical protein